MGVAGAKSSARNDGFAEGWKGNAEATSFRDSRAFGKDLVVDIFDRIDDSAVKDPCRFDTWLR